MMDDPNFIPARYFLAHPKQEISRLTASLLEDRYELSKVHTKQYGDVKKEETPMAEEKHLETSVPRVLIELKDAFITHQMKMIKEQMKQLHKSGDSDASIALMQQLKDLSAIKNALAKVLGERVILRY